MQSIENEIISDVRFSKAKDSDEFLKDFVAAKNMTFKNSMIGPATRAIFSKSCVDFLNKHATLTTEGLDLELTDQETQIGAVPLGKFEGVNVLVSDKLDSNVSYFYRIHEGFENRQVKMSPIPEIEIHSVPDKKGKIGFVTKMVIES